MLLFLLALSSSAQTLFLNAGGPAISDANGIQVYQPDAYYSSPSYLWLDDALGSGVDATLRYAPNFRYDIPLENGFYQITLVFVEPNKTGPKQRLFSATANGQTTDSIDVWALAGGVGKEYRREMIAVVGANYLHLAFAASVGNAVVSAIEVKPLMIVVPNFTVSAWRACHQNGVNVLPWNCEGIFFLRFRKPDGTDANMLAFEATAFAPDVSGWQSLIPAN